MDNTKIITLVSMCAYVVIILIIARSLSGNAKKTMAGFTLADKSLPWYIISASIMATVTNSAQVLGQAGGMYMLGISQGFWAALAACFVSCALLPVVGERVRYINCGTMTDLAEKRFPGSKRMNVLLLVWNVAWGCFGTSLCIFGGAIVLETLLGVPMLIGALITVVVAIVYTLIGGLSIISVVDTMQYIVIGLVVAIITPVMFAKYGTFSAFMAAFAGNTGYEITEMGKAMGITEGFFDIFHLPGWGFWGFAGYLLACSLWVPVDLGIIQRFLAEKKPGEGIKGIRFYGLVFVPTLFLMCSFGLWGKVLFDKITYVDSVALLVASDALGVIGTVLFMVVVTAAILSTVGAYYNALAAVLTQNVYMKIVKGKSEKHYLNSITVFTIIMGAVTYVIAPVFGTDGITLTAVAVQMIMCATLTPTILFMCFWKRFTEKAAFWGLICTTLLCIFSTYKAGGPFAAISGGGLFGIPTFFLGLIVIIPIFIIVSLLTPYDQSKTGPEFQALFADKDSFRHYKGKNDLIVVGIITVTFAIIAALGFSGKIAPFPAFSGGSAVAIDAILLLFSAAAGIGVIFLSYRLIRFLFIDKDFFTNQQRSAAEENANANMEKINV